MRYLIYFLERKILSLHINFKKMKKIIKLFFATVVIIIMTTSCEKACICRNIDNGSSDILYGVYSKKDCEAYTEYYQTVYNVDNVDCSYEWK